MAISTNVVPDPGSPLEVKGKALLEAAYAYWLEYQQSVGGSAAVIYVKDSEGHLVVFTRGEYTDDLMEKVWRHQGEPPLAKQNRKSV